MNDDELIKRYREQIESSSEKAPEGLWDGIAHKLDENLISQYRQQVDQHNTPAPEGIWENVERSLDNELITQYQHELAATAEKAPAGIWDAIAQELDKDEAAVVVPLAPVVTKKSLSIWAYAARVAAVIALITSLGAGAWLFFGRPQQPRLASREVNQPQPSAPQKRQDNLMENEAPNGENLSVAADTSGLLPVSEYQPRIQQFAPVELADTRVVLPENTAYNRLMPMQALLAYSTGQSLQIARLHTKEPKDAKEAEILPEDNQNNLFALNEEVSSSRAFAFGFSAGIKNTWLFANETFLGLAGHNGHRTEISLFPDMALTMRYRAKPRWEIEAGFSLSSNVGQSYYQYIHGRFSRKDISLNYIHGEIAANYLSKPKWVVGQMPVRFNSTFGLYFAGLNNASQSIAGEKADITQNYQNIDYGLILGQNVDIGLPGNFTFSPGIRLTWGLPNIHQRMPEIPEFMWRTLNRSLEFRITLLYSLPVGRQ